MSGFGNISESLGDSLDDALLDDVFFEDDAPLNSSARPSKATLPDIPKERPSSVEYIKTKSLARREDRVLLKPSSRKLKADNTHERYTSIQPTSDVDKNLATTSNDPYFADSNTANNLAPKNVVDETSPATLVNSKKVIIEKRKDYNSIVASKKQFSLNKIDDSNSPLHKTDLQPTTPVSDNVDVELRDLASDLDLFRIRELPLYQVASPTASEFISQYYRLINVLIYKVALNKLATKAVHVNGRWEMSQSIPTLNISGTSVYKYDSVYSHCVQDVILNKLRGFYEGKLVHFSKMTTHQVMGVGTGISSAYQATIYLEKMATISLSSTLGMLAYKDIMVNLRKWFEVKLPRVELRNTITNYIQSSVIRYTKEQASKFAKVDNVFCLTDHRNFIFAKKYLGPHVNIQIPNQQLQLSALIFLLSGVSLDNPNLHDINFAELFNNLQANESLTESLMLLAESGHRHCYPVNELSKFT